MTQQAAATEERVPFAIQVLRRLNPLMMGILRSPLHGLLSSDLLLLEYRGRRSGRELRLPLSYISHAGNVYLCTRSSKWVSNVRGGADVVAVIRGRRVAMRAEVLDPRSMEAVDALRVFVTANPHTGLKLYNVARGNDGRPEEADLLREVLQSRVVRLSDKNGARSPQGVIGQSAGSSHSA